MQRASEPLAPGTRLDDKYVVVRHLKTGGMGAVYEVEHTGLGKRLAAKLLLPELVERPELLERFRREARAASATGHENIVEVTDLGETRNGVPFLVMELLFGRTLGDELKLGRLLPERAVHITRQILAALGAAHRRSIVHRDLKPENIFLIQRASDTDFVKVLDFGIAKLLGPELLTDGNELTRAGQVIGTPSYMAPEQARGGEIDARADLYAVGAMLYRMVTGVRPFVAPSFNALLFAIAEGKLVPPSQHAPEVSAQLEAAIVRAMQVDPRARFQSAAELDEALSDDDRTAQKLPAPINFPPARDQSRPEWSQRSATMLGGATPGAAVRRAISRAMTLAIGFCLVVVLAGGTWLVVRRLLRLREQAELKREAEAARARVLAAPRPAFVVVTVEVEPSSARLTVDGAQIGDRLELVRDGARHLLRAEADGWQPEERSFLASADQRIQLRLKKRRTPSGRPKAIGPTRIDGNDFGDQAQAKQLEQLMQQLAPAAHEE